MRYQVRVITEHTFSVEADERKDIAHATEQFVEQARRVRPQPAPRVEVSRAPDLHPDGEPDFVLNVAPRLERPPAKEEVPEESPA
jgi:hypothetical protein